MGTRLRVARALPLRFPTMIQNFGGSGRHQKRVNHGMTPAKPRRQFASWGSSLVAIDSASGMASVASTCRIPAPGSSCLRQDCCTGLAGSRWDLTFKDLCLSSQGIHAHARSLNVWNLNSYAPACLQSIVAAAILALSFN